MTKDKDDAADDNNDPSQLKTFNSAFFLEELEKRVRYVRKRM
jgi:hypothetical protein